MIIRVHILAILLAVGLLADNAFAQSHQASDTSSAVRTREVHVTPESIVAVNGHVLRDTLLVLPAGERIVEIHCGSPEFWKVRVSAVEHIASAKPSKPGASTNAHIMTASGNIYSFDLTDVSTQPGQIPDEKVFIDADDTMTHATDSAPKWVPFGEVAVYQERAASAAAEAQARIDRALSSYPTLLRFTYRFDHNKRPFWIDQIWHDGQRTFLRTHATERAALYERLDGKPSLVQFEVVDGNLYVVGKVLDAGYLAIGDEKTEFRREQ